MEFKNQIWKKSNLKYNDSISTYNGWGAQQNPHAFEVFFNFIKNTKPSTIFEIGTSLGGFTQYLEYCCSILNLNTKIITFDIHDRLEYKELKQKGIEVKIENIFLNDYTKIPPQYVSLIQSKGVTIVLCDGGDKIKEFNLLSKYIKKGDFILGHDYAKTKEDFNVKVNKKLWNWFELQESDISKVCLEQNLKDFNQEKFNRAVWVCKQKQ